MGLFGPKVPAFSPEEMAKIEKNCKAYKASWEAVSKANSGGSQDIFAQKLRGQHMECLASQIKECKEAAASYRECGAKNADLAVRMHGYDSKTLQGAGTCATELAAVEACIGARGLQPLGGATPKAKGKGKA